MFERIFVCSLCVNIFFLRILSLCLKPEKKDITDYLGGVADNCGGSYKQTFGSVLPYSADKSSRRARHGTVSVGISVLRFDSDAYRRRTDVGGKQDDGGKR